MHRLASTLALMGALAVSLPAARGSADVKICNDTLETLFVTWVILRPTCAGQFYYNHTLVASARCTTLEEGASSQGRTFFYHAESQVSAAVWRGTNQLWLPNDPGRECLSSLDCTASAGQSGGCGTGRNYPMRNVYVSQPNHFESVRERTASR